MLWQIKKSLGKFLFVNCIILCVALVGAGSTVTAERTEYNMHRKQYSTVKISENEGIYSLSIDGKEKLSLDTKALYDKGKISDYLRFSGGGSLYYLLKTGKELFFG
mgnify:CR=1 FL=1